MKYRIGSVNWFENTIPKVGYMVIGIEIFHASQIRGRTRRKGEPRNLYYFSFLVNSNPENEPLLAALEYEEALLRDAIKGIYELRFRIEYFPQRHLLIPAAQERGFKVVAINRKTDYLLMVRNRRYRYLFEGS